mmetsp:Transcript_1748/g.2435  ORF Transcript_1748/g.2435 Transcript_1748/m.2435 type:complete len:239 (-) Transcript_1748:163-879(-)
MGSTRTFSTLSFVGFILQPLVVILLVASDQCSALMANAPVSNKFYFRSSNNVIISTKRTPQQESSCSSVKSSSSLEASSDRGGLNIDSDNTETQNPVYRLLATSRDNPPGSEFFYNDQVMSHLHGYMFLIGGLAAHDETFFFSFLALASAAAGATLVGALPANPRVPGMVAVLTLILTGTLRYVVGYEPMFFASQGYTGPDDSALQFEIAVSALNIGWGLLGSWQTKEPTSSGATTGF